MKKAILLPLLLAAASFSITSCSKEKDWTCECEIGGDRFTQPILDAKRGDARDACNALEDAGVECSLD